MQQIDPTLFLTILWGTTLLLIGLTWLPALLALLGNTSVQINGITETTELDPTESEADWKFWFDQAVQLDYEPLGSAWMNIRFEDAAWQRSTPIRVFRSRAKQTFLSFKKLPNFTGVWFQVEFVTCFANGGLLTTTNLGQSRPDFEQEHIRQGIPGFDLAALEIPHLAAIEVCRTRGLKAETEDSLEALLQTVARDLEPGAKRLGARQGWDFLMLHGIIHACGSVPAAVAFSFVHYGVALTNLILWLILALSSWADRGQKTQMLRMALRREIEKRKLSESDQNRVR